MMILNSAALLGQDHSDGWEANDNPWMPKELTRLHPEPPPVATVMLSYLRDSNDRRPERMKSLGCLDHVNNQCYFKLPLREKASHFEKMTAV
jgi:hypothetical protein